MAHREPATAPEISDLVMIAGHILHFNGGGVVGNPEAIEELRQRCGVAEGDKNYPLRIRGEETRQTYLRYL